ncbi:MAG: pre-peptidase C-terminal domain-containing protein [Chloroflexota bacterium]
MKTTFNTLRALFVMVLALSLASVAFAQEEISVGDSIEGEASEDIVEYEIELEEGQVIEINLEADWDTYLELYDDNGNFISSDDDGGDGLNSRLVYNADDTDTYVIRVRAFGDDVPTGDYELSVEELQIEDSVDMGELEYGDDEDIDSDDALSVVATFEGEAGDTIDIVTTSDDYLSTVLILQGPDGDEVAETENWGDAVLRNFELEESGTYTIIIEGRDGSILSGDIEVEVRESQVISLDNGEVEFEIGDGDDDFTFITFTAEDDVLYQVNILLDDEPDFADVSFFILEEGENITDYSEQYLRISGGLGGSYIFESDDDGVYTIRIEYYGSNDIDVTMSVEVLEQE